MTKINCVTRITASAFLAMFVVAFLNTAANAQCKGASPLSPVTITDETTNVPNSRQLVNGSNTTIDTGIPGKIKINASLSGGHNYFGSGTDGAVTYSANTTLGSSTPDTTITVKNYSSLTINSGVTVKPAARNQAVLIYVTGNCDIEGTLSVDALGANAAASQIDVWKYPASNNSFFSTESTNQTVTPMSTDYSTLTAGANGGAANSSGTAGSNGNPGSAGGTGQTGGGGGGAGGSGGTTAFGTGGAGAAGTAFCGGSGGGAGGFNASVGTNGTGAAGNGGAGGAGGSCTGGVNCSGGGSGNPPGAGSAGSGTSVTNATAGGGGTLYLIVGGNLTIGSSGIITANGSAGGSVTTDGVHNGAAGGGSGGGRIVILYAGSLSNSGTIRANGGAGGTSTSPGYSGGAGGAGNITGPLQIGGS